jgi:hypothetical protein
LRENYGALQTNAYSSTLNEVLDQVIKVHQETRMTGFHELFGD